MHKIKSLCDNIMAVTTGLRLNRFGQPSLARTAPTVMRRHRTLGTSSTVRPVASSLSLTSSAIRSFRPSGARTRTSVLSLTWLLLRLLRPRRRRRSETVRLRLCRPSLTNSAVVPSPASPFMALSRFLLARITTGAVAVAAATGFKR